MAKKQTSSNAKVTFGKRREGKHSKSLNKHASPKSKYVGQGK